MNRFSYDPSSPLLQVEHLSLSLPTERGSVKILDDVSFQVDRGEVVGLAGESGSGKTITALSIMRLLPSRPKIDGRILLQGVDLLSLSRSQMRHVRGNEISMVFQEPMSSLHPSWTVGEQIAESVRAHEQVSKKAAWARAVDMLRRVDIPNPEQRAKQYAFQFSGGMQQRAMIAIALVCRPKLLIADEPTTALDVTVQAQILELIRLLMGEFDMSVLFVTHDLGVLAGLTNRIVIMYGGQVAETARTGEMFADPLHPYTQALILAAPHPDMKGKRLPSIPGVPPHPGVLPSGCRFEPRCRYSQPRCAEQYVELAEPSPAREVRCLRHDELDLDAEIEGVST